MFRISLPDTAFNPVNNSRGCDRRGPPAMIRQISYSDLFTPDRISSESLVPVPG